MLNLWCTHCLFQPCFLACICACMHACIHANHRGPSSRGRDGYGGAISTYSSQPFLFSVVRSRARKLCLVIPAYYLAVIPPWCRMVFLKWCYVGWCEPNQESLRRFTIDNKGSCLPEREFNCCLMYLFVLCSLCEMQKILLKLFILCSYASLSLSCRPWIWRPWQLAVVPRKQNNGAISSTERNFTDWRQRRRLNTMLLAECYIVSRWQLRHIFFILCFSTTLIYQYIHCIKALVIIWHFLLALVPPKI